VWQIEAICSGNHSGGAIRYRRISAFVGAVVAGLLGVGSVGPVAYAVGRAAEVAVPRTPDTVSTSAERWDATTDFAAHPTVNPAPDRYGHGRVWSWMQGSFDTPSSYRLVTRTPTSALDACFSDPS
jgi:hypothetical protein